ncbi:hypothetical protein SK128_021805 [Halocaridina rubra]|uniref:Uncharacterized protein n=1 Tax=Halocaridina rubra TaxID=373956 RepID=A0AAN8WZT8_HALRR
MDVWFGQQLGPWRVERSLSRGPDGAEDDNVNNDGEIAFSNNEEGLNHGDHTAASNDDITQNDDGIRGAASLGVEFTFSVHTPSTVEVSGECLKRAGN